METIYIGNTLINDIFLGNQRMDDALQAPFAYTIEYLLVAGAGAGGGSTDNSRNGGAGGAGGLLSGSLLVNPITNYSIVVGAGATSAAVNAGNTTGFSLTSVRGGNGGEGNTANNNGSSGGSGGGGARDGGSNNGGGGAGTGGQGFNGAASTAALTAGGGGGAGSAASGATGGNGLASSINGTLTTYARGGTANVDGVQSGAGSGGNGGTGITGAGAGQDGIAIIRYLGPQRGIGGTVTTDGGYTIHTFGVGTTNFYSN